MKRLLLLIALLSYIGGYTQIFEEEEEYNVEWLWGVTKGTNGGLISGFVLRYAVSKGDVFETFGIELANIKHQSEQSLFTDAARRFIYGKTNYLYVVRLLYGRDKILFKKSDQQGILISAKISAGPILGIVKPYYVRTSDGEIQKFDPNIHNSPLNIVGPGAPFFGLGKSSIVPGISFRIATAFDFSSNVKKITGVEIGVALDIFAKKIILIPTQPNDFFYPSFFITLFGGRRI